MNEMKNNWSWSVACGDVLALVSIWYWYLQEMKRDVKLLKRL